jgi:hypothetical protein
MCQLQTSSDEKQGVHNDYALKWISNVVAVMTPSLKPQNNVAQHVHCLLACCCCCCCCHISLPAACFHM